MRRLLRLLLLPAAVLGARAEIVKVAPRAQTRIIAPDAPFGRTDALLIIVPSAPNLVTIQTPELIIPEALVLQAPAATIIVAVRPLTEEEIAPDKMPSQEDLKKLAESLAPTRDAPDAGAADADRARLLDSSFDGKLAPEASAWDDLSQQFARGPLAPGLPVVEAAARSLIARLLPGFYRRVPMTSAYDRSANPATGLTWTPEKGHLIEIAPIRADLRGEVPSVFGMPGQVRVQQKIEHLMEYAHEYFHALFDSAVSRNENHPPHSVYAALTEGFAVGGEQLLAERLLDMAPALGLGARDAMDLAAIARSRRQWLAVEDNHYSEGVISWRKAYEAGGVKGMLEFLAGLSAQRMIATPRSDSAYQLVLGDHQLLSAYLGQERSPTSRGLDAFAKAARGEELTDDEKREASSAVDQAGPEGWRRLFDRTLLADRRIQEPKVAVETGNWWEKKEAPAGPIDPVFVLARLSPSAGAELARYLAGTIASPGGAARLFGRPGPNGKLTAVVAGAESLPWDDAARRTWSDGLMRWLIGKL